MLVNIFGKRGAGKTTMIEGALPYCKRPVVIIDLLGNFAHLDPEEYYHSKDLADAVEFVRDYKSLEARGIDMDDFHHAVVVQAQDPNTTVEFIAAALWHAEGGSLVLDEVDAFSLSQAPCFDNLVRYGRNKGVHILTGCRRPAEINRNITAGANKIFVFQTQEPRDIDYFEKTILGERAERLISLKPYHGLFIDYDKKLVGEFETNEKGEVFVLSTETLQN